MTTSNIPQLEELEAMARRVDEMMVEAVRTRSAELQAEADRLEGQRARLQREFEAAEANALIAARLRQQVHTDRNAGIDAARVPVDEELGQLSGVLNGRPVDPAPAPADPAPQPVVVVPAPTQVVTTPPAAVRERSTYHPRNWTVLAWLLAILGLIAAWWITGANWDKPFHDSWGSFFIWFGASLIGLSVGGLLGQLIANRQQNTNTGQPVPVQVAPAQPRQFPPPPTPAA